MMKPPFHLPPLCAAALLLAPVILPARADEGNDVRMAGAPSVAPILEDMAHVLGTEKGLQFHFSGQGGSDAGVQALGLGETDIAVLSRPLTGEDQSEYPDVILHATPIGAEVVAIGVANDVWDGGLHAITKETMRSIYEQKVKRWTDIGGPEEQLIFFNFDEGHGVWEIFAEWLYGDNRKAPEPKVQKLHNMEDASDTLEFTPGAIAPISPLVADGSRCHALAIQTPDGQIVQPTPANVANGTYPMTRPIVLVTIGRPTLNERAVTDFMLSPAGQAILRKHGAFGLDAVPKPKGEDSQD